MKRLFAFILLAACTALVSSPAFAGEARPAPGDKKTDKPETNPDKKTKPGNDRKPGPAPEEKKRRNKRRMELIKLEIAAKTTLDRIFGEVRGNVRNNNEALEILPDILAALGEGAVIHLIPKFPDAEIGPSARIAVAKITGVYIRPGGYIDNPAGWWGKNRLEKPETVRARHEKKLLELAGDEDPVVRCRAAFGMRFLDLPGVKKKLHEMLTDSNVRVRWYALHALVELGDRTVLDKIEKESFLAYKPPLGAEAVRAYGLLGDKSDAEKVRKILDHKLVPMRISAAEALLKLGDSSGIEKLKDVVKDKTGEKADRTRAVRILARTGNESLIGFFNEQLGTFDFTEDSSGDFAFTEIGYAIERLMLRSYSFAGGNANQAYYTDKETEKVKELRKAAIDAWTATWEEKKNLDRVTRLINDSLTDMHWCHRYLAYKELRRLTGKKDLKFDPFGIPRDRYDQVALWKDWLATRKNE